MADVPAFQVRLRVVDVEGGGPRVKLDVVLEPTAGDEAWDGGGVDSDFTAFDETIVTATWLLRLRARQGDREWVAWATSTFEDSTLGEEPPSLVLWLAPGAVPTSYEVDFQLNVDPHEGRPQTVRFSGSVAGTELEAAAPPRENERGAAAAVRRMRARAELSGPPFVTAPDACLPLEGVVATAWTAPGPSGYLTALPELGRLYESAPGGALHICERERLRMFATSFEALARRAGVLFDSRRRPGCVGGPRGHVAIFWPSPVEPGRGFDHDVELTVFSTNDGALLARHRTPPTLLRRTAMFDASGRWFLFEGPGGPFLIDLSTGALRALADVPGCTSDASERATYFDADGVWFAGSMAVGRYDFASSTCARVGDLPPCWDAPPDEVGAPAFLPALRRVAAPVATRHHDSGPRCSALRVYDPRAGLTTFDLGHVNEVHMLDDGRVVAAGDRLLWLIDPDAPPGRQLYEIGPYGSAPMSPLGLECGTSAVHVTRRGDRHRLWLGSERAWCVEFSAKAAVDDRPLSSAGADGRLASAGLARAHGVDHPTGRREHALGPLFVQVVGGVGDRLVLALRRPRRFLSLQARPKFLKNLGLFGGQLLLREKLFRELAGAEHEQGPVAQRPERAGRRQAQFGAFQFVQHAGERRR
jgi:hypothetical protein